MHRTLGLACKVYRRRECYLIGLLQPAIFMVAVDAREGIGNVLAELAAPAGFMLHDWMCFVEADGYCDAGNEDEEGAEEVWKCIWPIAHPSYAILATNCRVRTKYSRKRSDWVGHEPAPVIPH